MATQAPPRQPVRVDQTDLDRRPRPPARRAAWALGHVTAIVALSSVAAAVALAGPPVGSLLADPGWLWLRLPLGVLALLVLPGYALALALYPRFRDLDGAERFGMAVGLSLAQGPLLALALDRSPWGLSPQAIVQSFTLLTWFWCAAAVVRLLTTAREDLFTARWWGFRSMATTTRLERLALLGGLALLAVVGVSLRALLVQPPVPPLTEFYMLGPTGLAQDYPRASTIGQPVTVTLGVHNLEGRPMEYHVLARHDDTDLADTAPFRVADGETWTGPLAFPLDEYGFGQRIDILLLRAGDDAAVPYRQLTLVVDVAQPGVPTPVVVVATPARTAVRPEPTLVQNPAVPTPAPPIRVIPTPGAQP
jgi:uncharacterized membrane protein